MRQSRCRKIRRVGAQAPPRDADHPGHLTLGDAMRAEYADQGIEIASLARLENVLACENMLKGLPQAWICQGH